MSKQEVSKNYNLDKFQYDMSCAPWSVLEIFDDVDDKSHAFDLLLTAYVLLDMSTAFDSVEH